MKKILINYEPWQTRIAITTDAQLQNVYFTSHTENPLEHSFFIGIVTKVLPGIQTAFVDIGQEKAGFLHISEIDRELALRKVIEQTQLDDDEDVQVTPAERKQSRDISNILKEGGHILVQVSKEPVYEKGAKLTTCFTLPGRFIVLMPNIGRIGVSKKIADREERKRLRTIVREHLPEGMGAIIRTTSDEREKNDIVKDINYLLDQWNEIQDRAKKAKSVECLYRDIELPQQIVRDHLDKDVEEIIIDDQSIQRKIYNFIRAVSPEHIHKIVLHTGIQGIFEHYGINRQIEGALSKKVPLKSGGSLIIETTEAMSVIDVNTGRFVGKKNLEETILKTNLEAAGEIVRQLRLRNIGGLIVIDFIDMAQESNRQKLSRHFEKNLRKRDKFQSVVLKVSEFGLVQMTRKRSGKTLIAQLTDACNCCKGMGFTKSLQTETYTLLRKLKHVLKTDKPKSDVTLKVHPDIFEYISSIEYKAILELEQVLKNKIILAKTTVDDYSQYSIEYR